MDAVHRIMEGAIDPYSQYLVEWYSQVFLGLLVTISFILSYLTQSVLIGLEVFAGGFALLLLACVPPWPYINRFGITFLPVRRGKSE